MPHVAAGSLAQATRSVDIVRAVAAGVADHLADAVVRRVASPDSEPRFGMCGRLRTFDTTDGRGHRSLTETFRPRFAPTGIRSVSSRMALTRQTLDTGRLSIAESVAHRHEGQLCFSRVYRMSPRVTACTAGECSRRPDPARGIRDQPLCWAR